MKLLHQPYTVEEIKIPKNIDIKINDTANITVKGPKGSLTKDFSHAKVLLRKEEDKIIVESYIKGKRGKSICRTIASHIRNMIKGVSEGFTYKLKIVYAHFPMNVKVEGRNVIIENFRGEKEKRIARIVGSAKVRVEGDDIIVEGIDLEEVSQTAANIEHATRIKGYDPRVFMDGIFIYERKGKSMI
ncbi:MAG: 50S ribosomal protein L6 [Candidatus Nezhaarchaeota archaeon]|nr:50S ribosomal protein L6 [Candidatus Nezhaarchaeota archaeon]MCX8141760.1 50S ribosomal protein L6 [Candidatus Nezhaarchaeota archaeon]MDW8050462.1 50S ribosomal protein L6 [Nitrososphaerota archaeon]